MIDRRRVLKWSAPVVTMVVLPAHATTSEIPEEPPCDDCGPVVVNITTTPAPPTTEPPVTTTAEPKQCKDRKVQICHMQPKKRPVTICVDKHSVKKHVKLHKDYIGSCK